MSNFSQELNNILVATFRTILKVEEQMIRQKGKVDLSISEMHLIESVGKNQNRGRTISDIAEDLNITLPSVTIAINKLVRKGYVNKIKAENDGRVVYATLTKLGLKMDTIHRRFHENMVRNIEKEMTEAEKAVLVPAIQKLNAFFERKLLS